LTVFALEAALKERPALKTLHATVEVTRLEEWCVEAHSSEEARELLVAGGGYRSHIGDCLHIAIDRIQE
jgi:hypothetical protein